MPLYDEELMREFKDKEYRQAYANDFLNTKIATQIRVIRDERGLTQKELAELIGTKQPGIARLEDVNYANWNINTLRKIASAFDVILNVSFETFGFLLNEDKAFSRKWLKRSDFEHDPVFAENVVAATASVSPNIKDTAAIASRVRTRKHATSTAQMSFWPMSVSDKKPDQNPIQERPVTLEEKESTSAVIIRFPNAA